MIGKIEIDLKNSARSAVIVCRASTPPHIECLFIGIVPDVKELSYDLHYIGERYGHAFVFYKPRCKR